MVAHTAEKRGRQTPINPRSLAKHEPTPDSKPARAVLQGASRLDMDPEVHDFDAVVFPAGTANERLVVKCRSTVDIRDCASDAALNEARSSCRKK
jgi:hypothetical protein